MKNIDAKMLEANDYKAGSASAFAVADAYREGAEGITELICSGDAPYLILTAVNIITEAAKKMNISEERLNTMIENIKKELLSGNSDSLTS